MNIEISLPQIRSYRLRAHHLDRKLPPDGLLAAAGACGLQNSPPGAWETALFNRLEGCTLSALQAALYQEKSLLQAWSFRGAPAVFPTAERDVFLTPLMAREGEEPWIYTMGITAALESVGMTFDDLLLRTMEAAKYLDTHTIVSKEALDRTLAGIVEEGLPRERRAAWREPSVYGSPDRQTMGGAAVSFLLRPCSFASLVVFGERQGVSPTFTSYKNWTGREQEAGSPMKRCTPEADSSMRTCIFGADSPVRTCSPDADRELVRRFLHCYGPATRDSFMGWLGCSRRQARRLWDAAADETEPVLVCGKTRYMLSSDMEDLFRSGEDGERGDRAGGSDSRESSGERLILLGAHDPYLDIKDRTVILADPSRHKEVWKTVANPGAVLKGGRIIGAWKTKTQKDNVDISIRLFEVPGREERKKLAGLAGEYAAFRRLTLRNCVIEEG